jgi:hypothetical protein
MPKEQVSQPAPRRPYEVFDLTEEEVRFWRVNQDRFREIINDDQTIIHTLKTSSNNYGKFLFVTTSRQGDHARIAITFFGLGYHEHRERWLTNEWFWYQTNIYPEIMRSIIEKEEAENIIRKRLESILPYSMENTQTDYGRLFEILADLTDEDGVLAELQDLERVSKWVLGDPEADSGPEPEFEPPPTGENLLDKASQEKLPPLYSGEEQGLDALAQVKFFTPDAQWTWYASEFDGEDIFFGLVIGLEIELGYFSLSELKSVKGPLGLQIERDLHYDPQTLRELKEKHQSKRD